jgi:hypothetical protein
VNDPIWEIDQTLKARGFKFLRPPLIYRGPIFPHGHEAIVEITIPDTTFVKMPEIKLVDKRLVLLGAFRSSD